MNLSTLSVPVTSFRTRSQSSLVNTCMLRVAWKQRSLWKMFKTYHFLFHERKEHSAVVNILSELGSVEEHTIIDKIT